MKKIYILPSFYAFLGFTIPMIGYFLRLIKWNDPYWISVALYITFSFSILLSIYVSSGLTDNYYNEKYIYRKKHPLDMLFFYGISTVGLLGYILYLSGLIDLFGGIGNLLLSLETGAQQIRVSEVHTIGTQLSYFNWMACSITSYWIAKKELNKIWIIYILLSLLLSLGYVDRVKPISILFFSLVGFLLGMAESTIRIKNKDVIKMYGKIISVALLLYLMIALSLGKIGAKEDYGETMLPPALASIYGYSTSGYAYLNDMIVSEDFQAINVDRFIYPIKKLFFLTKESDINPAILDFRAIPTLTNVATGLEPIYSSLGLYGLLAFCVTAAFIFDALFFSFLNWNSVFKVSAIATLCWTTFFLFFTARYLSIPFYILLISSLLMNSVLSILKHQPPK